MANISHKAKIEGALELISDGLERLDELIDSVPKGSKAHVDLTARLNAQSLAITKYLDGLKRELKEEAIESHKDIFLVKGVHYQAKITKFLKTYPLMDDIKKFLGKKLPQFQEVRQEYQLSFGAKE